MSAGFSWEPFLGSFHPVVLHLPIGLLAAGVAVELASWRWPDETVRRVRRVVYALAGLSAVLAGVTGWLIASGGDFTGLTVERHRWFAVALTGVMLALPISDFFWPAERARNGVRVVMLGAAVLLVAMAGHLGGSLTHGRGHLARHAPGWLAPVLGGQAFDATTGLIGHEHEAITILRAHCFGCHGPDDPASGLRVDLPEGLASVVAPFDAAQSELFRRVVLPAGHSDAMPPGDEPLRGDEILAILRWINAGADTAALESAAQEAAEAEAVNAGVRTATGAIVVPQTGDSTGGLRVDFAMREGPVTQSDFGALGLIAPRVVELGLAGRDVGEVEDWALFPALESVHLERSNISDEQVVALVGGSPELAYLNLHSTSVTDAALAVIEDLPGLRRVVLYQTATTAEGISALRDARPGVLITAEEGLDDE